MAVLIVALSLLALLIVAGVKNEVTCRMQIKISTAIYNYKVALIDEDPLAKFEVDYDDMEDYSETLIRFWDWGYKRILPRDKFEIIKPFIYHKKKGKKR